MRQLLLTSQKSRTAGMDSSYLGPAFVSIGIELFGIRVEGQPLKEGSCTAEQTRSSVKLTFSFGNKDKLSAKTGLTVVIREDRISRLLSIVAISCQAWIAHSKIA